MTPATAESLRAMLARNLPGLVETVLAQYRDLVTMDMPQEDKERAARQTAAKATLGHIEHLVRIAAGVLPPAEDRAAGGAETPDDPAGPLLAQARAAIARMEAADDGDAEG
ncbi:MAG: hypothetical protein AB7G39_12675 [Alphaproteobacteria bacterium]